MLSNDQSDALWKLIKPIKVGMLASWDGHMPHARPMHHVNDSFEGTLLFYTKASAEKSEDIKKFPEVCLTYSDHHQQHYVCISGVAELSRDQHLIDQYWNPFVAAWFPDGKQDPDITMLKIHVHQAETWDAPSSKMVQLFKIAKANITHQLPDMGEHKKFG